MADSDRKDGPAPESSDGIIKELVASQQELIASQREMMRMLVAVKTQIANAENKFHQIAEWFFETCNVSPSSIDQKKAEIARLIAETADIFRQLLKS